jgi:hypothetical protein
MEKLNMSKYFIRFTSLEMIVREIMTEEQLMRYQLQIEEDHDSCVIIEAANEEEAEEMGWKLLDQ